MDSRLLFIIAAVFIDGLAGLAGGLLPSSFLQRNIVAFLSLAAGVLIGTAFLDLLPEALEGQTTQQQILQIMGATVAGFVVFYCVERFLGNHASGQKGHRHDHVGSLILVGDSMHNITDGLAITAAFLTDVRTGILTSLTVVLHELPQEVADYTILLSRGWSKASALLALFIVQLTAFIGVYIALVLASPEWNLTPYLLAFSAGGFIYIAAADLLPELYRRDDQTKPFVKLLFFALGIAVIGLTNILVAHH